MTNLFDFYDDINKRYGVCNQWGDTWGCQNAPFKGHAWLTDIGFITEFQYGIYLENLELIV